MKGGEGAGMDCQCAPWMLERARHDRECRLKHACFLTCSFLTSKPKTPSEQCSQRRSLYEGVHGVAEVLLVCKVPLASGPRLETKNY